MPIKFGGLSVEDIEIKVKPEVEDQKTTPEIRSTDSNNTDFKSKPKPKPIKQENSDKKHKDLTFFEKLVSCLACN